MSGLNVRVTGRRVVATLIDVVFLGLVAQLVFSWDSGLSIAVVLLVVVAYYITGRTVGRYATGIRVVDAVTGRAPGLGKALVRTVLRILDCQFAYLVGFLVVLASDRRCRTGDKTARTLVVRA